MEGKDHRDQDEIYSKVLRAGRRTYFFDVRSTKADDYYLTITESKKFTQDDGSHYYKKHKIYLYKEDFEGFRDMLEETTQYITDQRGEDIITDYSSDDDGGHSTDSRSDSASGEPLQESLSDASDDSTSKFTDLDFEEL